MSAAGNSQEVSRPALAIALLLIVLTVGLTVFDGTVRTLVVALAGVGLVVSSGYAGAAIRRGKRRP